MRLNKNGQVATFLKRWHEAGYTADLPNNVCPLIRALIFKVSALIFGGFLTSYLLANWVVGTLTWGFNPEFCSVGSSYTFTGFTLCVVPILLWPIALLVGTVFLTFAVNDLLNERLQKMRQEMVHSRTGKAVENVTDVWHAVHGKICPPVKWENE